MNEWLTMLESAHRGPNFFVARTPLEVGRLRNAAAFADSVYESHGSSNRFQRKTFVANDATWVKFVHEMRTAMYDVGIDVSQPGVVVVYAGPGFFLTDSPERKEAAQRVESSNSFVWGCGCAVALALMGGLLLMAKSM